MSQEKSNHDKVKNGNGNGKAVMIAVINVVVIVLIFLFAKSEMGGQYKQKVDTLEKDVVCLNQFKDNHIEYESKSSVGTLLKLASIDSSIAMIRINQELLLKQLRVINRKLKIEGE